MGSLRRSRARAPRTLVVYPVDVRSREHLSDPIWSGEGGTCIVCAWSLFPLSTLAAGDESDEKALGEVREVVKQLQARYERTKDLQADFTQKTMIEGFERPITSSGKVYIKKPGRLRWA